MKETNINYPEFDNNLSDFLNHIESLNETLPLTIALLNIKDKSREEELKKFLAEKDVTKEKAKIEDTTDVENIEEEEYVTLKNFQDAIVFEELQKNIKISNLAFKVIPESLFVSLISQYDAFLGKLIKIIFELYPEKLNSSEKNLTFSLLNSFENIEKAKEYIIEKEVESILRESHCYHFEWLEKKLNLPLRKKLPIWPTFMEITERRNLFVHTHGVVTSQYLAVCKKHNVNLAKKIKVGSQLSVSPKYFEESFQCLYEITVKLTQVIWRKLISNDLEDADASLNDICLDLIQREEYKLADILLEFATEILPNHFNEMTENIFIINKALSKYLAGKKEEAKKILSKTDWSAKSNNFKLAVAVLEDDYEDIYPLMEIVGNSNEIPRHAFQTWPLFKFLRKKKEFKDKYKEIYDEDFVLIERPSRTTIKLLEKKSEKQNKE
ncbi:hypothetical protein BA195_13620 [Tenacibaculum soleae]|uniref:Uncharacterized protein n=1 Tax=Tenacibaculum soleae TaxID=447689 RepID=A0A1B9XW91_9FLAO|nr:hypothetical protein [Tenacibaculum soleae]OCK41825.1 hypothetical protein BA195_13620 [Tenacibaculum soleae]